MIVQKRTLKDGSYYYSFLYEENGKKYRLKKDSHPYFTRLEDAERWAAAQEGYRAAEKDRLKKKLEWKTKYYNFSELLPKFEIYKKEKAPNKYRDHVKALEYYVLPFFLTEKHLGNVNDWLHHFREFRDWLNNVKSVRSGKLLSAAYKNTIISVLNSFMIFLNEYNLIDSERVSKCGNIEKHKIKYRDHTDYITLDEFRVIYTHLKRSNELVSDFWLILYYTGMRFNELMSLPISQLHKGELTGPLQIELQTHNLIYFGYIVLESQCDTRAKKRDSSGKLIRKPLKSCKTISPKNNRTIPITDKEAWNTLVRLFKIQQERLLKNEYGPDKNQYLFFSDLKETTATRELSKAYNGLSYKTKTFHCLRHTLATNLMGLTRSSFLARNILGHKSSEVFEQYNHIYEQITIKAQENTQEIEFVE